MANKRIKKLITKKERIMGKSYCMITTTLERYDGRILYDISAEGYVHYTKDNRYGEDAEGCRGESRLFVDDVTDVAAWDIDGEEIELSPSEAEQLGDELIQHYIL